MRENVWKTPPNMSTYVNGKMIWWMEYMRANCEWDWVKGLEGKLFFSFHLQKWSMWNHLENAQPEYFVVCLLFQLSVPLADLCVGVQVDRYAIKYHTFQRNILTSPDWYETANGNEYCEENQNFPAIEPLSNNNELINKIPRISPTSTKTNINHSKHFEWIPYDLLDIVFSANLILFK